LDTREPEPEASSFLSTSLHKTLFTKLYRD
jgi:hypothetical protein